MKLHILSDLHLEFSGYTVKDLNADVIILPGDIGVGMMGIEWAAQLLNTTNAHILYLCGNHEFYHHNLNTVRKNIREYCVTLNSTQPDEIQDRLHFLDNSEVIIDQVLFLGTTLWTDFKLFGEELKNECMEQGKHYLNDFQLINYDNLPFSTQDSIDLHDASVKWLTHKLKNDQHDGKTVVISHHLPSFESVVARYQKDKVSACFASRLDHLLEYADLWIHGHTHDSLDYFKNGTRVICNPRGYYRYKAENSSFNPNLIVDI